MQRRSCTRLQDEQTLFKRDLVSSARLSRALSSVRQLLPHHHFRLQLVIPLRAYETRSERCVFQSYFLRQLSAALSHVVSTTR